jgi:hypothetical protein
MLPPDHPHALLHLQQQQQQVQLVQQTEAPDEEELVPEHIVAACARQRSLHELLLETDASMFSRFDGGTYLVSVLD